MSRLEVTDLSVEIGGQRILSEVSLSVEAGAIVGLLGANGAGKSTTIDAVTGYQKITGGAISLDGFQVTGKSAPARAKLGITRTFQDYLLFEDQTVEENLLCAAEIGTRKSLLRDIGRFGRVQPAIRAQVDEALRAHGLEKYRFTRVEQLSLGWHARVNLARAAVQKPKLLLLDEPAAALSLDARHQIVATIREIRDGGDVAILLVEHNLDVVREVCDEIYILDDGAVIAHGRTAEILDHPQVRAIYFGEQPDETELVHTAAPGVAL